MYHFATCGLARAIMTQETQKKRRARRIAADEAHAWARNLRLGNAHAKYVLCMLTLYVNGDGVCFVSIPQLADDCELAGETIRRRLAWLEEVGALARRAQWIDENGRRNGEGRGRRTSDEIVLLVDVDPEEIEAQAKGNGDADPLPQTGSGDGADPIPQTGSNPVSPPVGTPLAPSLRRGPESSEPEHEDSPQPPKMGGGQEVDQEFEDQITQAQRAYPIPITNLPRFRIVWAAQARDIRPKILTAMRGFAAFIADCERRNKPRAVKDADRWVASGMWEGYVTTGEKADAAALITPVPVDSELGRAWSTIAKIARLSAPFENHGHFILPRPLTPREVAFANAPPERDWIFIGAHNAHEIAAWNEFMRESLSARARPELVQHRWQNKAIGTASGFLAPWRWPPSKEGKIYNGGTGPPNELMTEDDENVLTELGKMTG